MNRLFILILIVLAVALALVFIPNWARASDDLGMCDAWRDAGGQTIYRCQDDQTDDRCYVHSNGFLFCVGS